MAQGPIKNFNSPTKREPIAHAVDPGAVSQLGAPEGGPSPQLYQGRGFEAPKISSTSYNSGSQGKHK